LAIEVQTLSEFKLTGIDVHSILLDGSL